MIPFCEVARLGKLIETESRACCQGWKEEELGTQGLLGRVSMWGDGKVQ